MKIVDRNAVWAPDSQKIAFGSIRTGNDDIWVVNLDGTVLSNLTTDSLFADFNPSWSPDGRYIAFVSERAGKGNYDIWIMQSDGSNPRNLTGDYSGLDTEPRWSPDGKYIAFVSDRSGRPDIWLLEFSTSEISNLTEESKDVFFASLSWSTDSQFVSFVGVNEEGKSGILFTSIAAPDLVDVSSHQSETYSVLSPAGQIIVFHSKRDGNWDIWRVDADGTDLVNLTSNNTQNDSNPSWSPDGKRIAYTAEMGSRQDIWFMNMDGSNKSNLTKDIIMGVNPVWSPDGNLIAFESREGNTSIWIINPDGSNPVNLTGY